MGLFRHVVLVQVGAFHRLALHTRGTFLFLLFHQQDTFKWSFQVVSPKVLVSKEPLYLSCCFHGLVLLLIWINQSYFRLIKQPGGQEDTEKHLAHRDLFLL